MAETRKSTWWTMIVLLVILSALALYKIFINNETAYIQFAIVAALGSTILKRLPLFVKFKNLNIIPVAVAVILLVLGILETIKN